MMQMTIEKKRLSVFLCIVLTAALALSVTGCGKTDTAVSETAVYDEDTELGEGAKTFTLTVTDADDKVVNFTIHSDADTVGEELLADNLIAGEDSDYGLYVKTVNGVTADYDTDGSYWAFYIDGEYAMTGVDSTEITDGAVYALTVEQ